MEWEELLNAFLEIPDEEEDPEYDAAETKYEETFGHVPPRAMICDGYSREEMIAAMNQCVAEGEEDILKVLGIVIDDRFIY